MASEILTQHIADHFRAVHFGGNWTSVNLKDSLADITWEEATRKIETLNTIAALVFHCNYYISNVLKVLQGEPLNARDSYSFDLPPIHSEADWNRLKQKTLAEAESFATLIEQLPGDKLWQPFVDAKYGNYYRNLVGIIEHTHYHLGQIVLLKKMIQGQALNQLPTP